MKKVFSLMLCLTGIACGAAQTDAAALRTWADAAWTKVKTTYYSAKTGNIYICPPTEVSPASDFPGGLLKPELGYGKGLEDCAINGGVALSGLVDKYALTRDPAVRDDAAQIARGLLNLVSAHPYKGFVARGLCVEDGTSICRLSSRDQVTHWAHGLYRYVAHGLASAAEKAEIAARFVDVSERMRRNVTKANGWNFLQADGTMDPRGICKMRETYPHEAARLAMVYALTWKLTGDAQWRTAYEEVRAEALDGSCALATAPQELTQHRMPDYTLLQMNTSLEALLDVETDATCRAQIVRAMVVCARLAAARANRIRGAETRWLCGCAEVHLAQLMTPPDAFAYTAEQQAILVEALMAKPVAQAGATRCVHLFAAYWRLRVRTADETTYAPETASRAERFANPPASARILPLVHGRANDLPKADAEMAALKAAGFGGFGGNVNFDKYLDDPASWRTFRHTVEKAHALGMSLWLYDEKGYPSATAGGKTLEDHPEWQARAYLVAVTNVPMGSTALPPAPPGRPVATIRRPSADGASQTVYVVTDDFIHEGTHISVSVSHYKYAYPNLLMAEPTARFIELTHDAYKRELGPALAYFTSTFTDEPSLMTHWMKPMPYVCLPVSDELLAAYRTVAGHPLAEDVPDLVAGEPVGAVAAKRHRFWSMVGDRVARNYTGQLTRWATENGLLSGGHLLCEEGLVAHVSLYGDFFKVLRGLSAPSCDLLTSVPARVPWITPLLVGSAGELNGARRVMSEASDHGEKYRPKGDSRPVYQVSVREVVGALNRQIWGGVNTFTSYYRWQPFSTAEKRAINAEIGRAITLLSEGRSAAEIALLYPADALQVGFEPRLKGAGGRGAQRTAGFVSTAGNALFHANRTFMFVDADTLAAATVVDGQLVSGPLRWRTVVLPGVTTLARDAVRKLDAFRRAGGLVIALGDRPVNSTTAFPDDEVARLTADWTFLSDDQAGWLADFLDVAHPPVLRVVAGETGVLRTAHRRTAQGDVFFVLNDSGATWSGAVALDGSPDVTVWNPRVGLSSSASGAAVPLDLPPYGALLLTTPTPVTGRVAPLAHGAFKPRLVPFTVAPQEVTLSKGTFVSGTATPGAEGWYRVDTTLTKGDVDTFAFLQRRYDRAPFSARAKGVGFSVRVPASTGGQAMYGVFLRTRDGTLWYARGGVSLSEKGTTEVSAAFNAFGVHGKGGTAGRLDPREIVQINFGYGGYFGRAGEKVVFEVSAPRSLEL